MEESSSLLQRQTLSIEISAGEGKPGRASGSGAAATVAKEPGASKFEGYENLCNYELESLDYDMKVVGAASRQERPTYMGKLFKEAMKWGVCLVVGALTAAIAFTVNVGVENIAGFKFWLTFSLMKGGSGAMFGAYLVFTIINCTLAGLASSVVTYYGPGAAGSGIPDVKAFLNGVNLPNVLSPQTLIAKIVGSIGAVSASLAVGKEGPFVHIGACLAFLLTQGEKVHPMLKSPLLNVFRNDRQLRDFVTCGAAAGVAAAFRAPVGGVLFALEEATSWWRNQILWLAFFTTAVVSVVLRSMIRHCHVANCGFFGAGGFILFSLDEGQDSYEIFELLPMLLLGVMGGLLGSAFNVLNAQLTIWRQGFFQNRRLRARVVEAVLIALLTSTVAFGMPLLVSCQSCPEAHAGPCPRNASSFSGNYVQFNCDSETQHNDMATLFFNTQDDAIRSLLSSKNNKEYTVNTLLGYFISFFALATLTYGVAVPSGLFVPSILCGASYGRLVGMFVIRMHPNHSIDEGTYALLGAAGFLGGASRMTVSLCVIMLELTNNMALLPLIMLVLLVAKGVGDSSGVKAIYDIHVDLKGVPFLEPQPERFMQHITAREISSKPIFFQRFESVGHIRNVLESNRHNGFPVISEEGSNSVKLLGVVLRSNLQKVLNFQDFPMASMITVDGRKREGGTERQLSAGDEVGTIDLVPMIDSSHYVVDENMPASKVHNLFRQLGLRHVVVVPRAPKASGIITRKDLLPDILENISPSTSSTDSGNFPAQAEDDSRAATRRRKTQEGNGSSKGD